MENRKSLLLMNCSVIPAEVPWSPTLTLQWEDGPGALGTPTLKCRRRRATLSQASSRFKDGVDPEGLWRNVPRRLASLFSFGKHSSSHPLASQESVEVIKERRGAYLGPLLTGETPFTG